MRTKSFFLASVLILLARPALAVTTFITDYTGAWSYQNPKINFGWDEIPLLYMIPSGTVNPPEGTSVQAVNETWTAPDGIEYSFSYGTGIGPQTFRLDDTGTRWNDAKKVGIWTVRTSMGYPLGGGRLLEDIPYTAFSTFNVAAIPEPETWAMLMAGVGLLGFAARRRKRHTA